MVKIPDSTRISKTCSVYSKTFLETVLLITHALCSQDGNKTRKPRENEKQMVLLKRVKVNQSTQSLETWDSNMEMIYNVFSLIT